MLFTQKNKREKSKPLKPCVLEAFVVYFFVYCTVLAIQYSKTTHSEENIMTKSEMAKEALERKLEAYKKYQLFTEKQKLDEQTDIIRNQIKSAERVRLINDIYAREYLSKLKKAYQEHLAKEQFKEWREHVLNFNDDYITGMERLFVLREGEERSVRQSAESADKGFSLSSWRSEIERDGETTGNSGNSEREEISHDKQEEREEEKIKEI